MSDIEQKTQELIQDILSSDLFKRYIKIKKAYETDKTLNDKKAKLNQEKKYLSQLSNEELPLKIRELMQLEKEIEQDPLTILYRKIKTETEEVLSPLRDIFRLS